MKFIAYPAILTGVAAIAMLGMGSAGYAERAVPIPAPIQDVKAKGATQTALLAGGCFWGMEAVFENVKGVKSVESGYAGGTADTATYAQVSTERTGHAEVIKISYDPSVVSYGTLLRVYFSVAHDPTQLNRQGPDTGPSYRSAIFPQNAEQKVVAARYMAQLLRANPWGKPLVTKIEQGKYYPAEEYHQDFFVKNPSHPYIVRWDKPKLAAFKAGFPQLAKAS